MPDDMELTAQDRALYYAVKDMYALFRAGRINAQTGAERKRLAVRQWNMDNAAIDGNAQLVRNRADYWKRIEAAGAAYARQRTSGAADPEQTIRLADEMFLAVYGVTVTVAQYGENGQNIETNHQQKGGD